MQPARLLRTLGALLVISGNAEAQDQRNEQFYFPGSFNWQFLQQYPEGGRLFNAFDYGHAILYEKLLTRPAHLGRELEQRQFDYLTTDLLVRPPRFAVAEEAIEPAYSKLAWRAKMMFDWAHILHRQIYDIYADPRLTPAQRDRLIERVTDYYLSNRRFAFTTQPKSMALMDDQYYSQVFRRQYPKFNGLIWAYHWLQVGLYEPLIEGRTPSEKKAGVQTTIARFWSMIEEPPTRFPKVMPMTSAVAPLFSAAHPRAAVIFDNLHMTHDIISDILASDTVPGARKREVIYAALDQMQDSTRDIMTMAEWQTMGEMMGGVGIMGGPATGILPEVPTLGAEAPVPGMAGMDHGAMNMGAGGKTVADSAAMAPVAPDHPMAHVADSTADPADSMARMPGMDHRNDDMMASMMQLHQRMLTDSVIRGRVQADTAMRRMMNRMMEMMGPNRTDSMPMMMNHAPAGGGTDPHGGHTTAVPAEPSKPTPPATPPAQPMRMNHAPATQAGAAPAAAGSQTPADSPSYSWLPLHSGHPLMVHLPLVALPLAVLLDLLAIWKQDPRWREMATVLWWLGLVGVAAAVTTGLIAYDRVNHSDAAHKIMTLHRNVALGAVALFLLTGAARWRWSSSRPAVFLGGLAVAGIVGAGYLGGEIVFRHAIGMSTGVLEQVMMERGGSGPHMMPDPAMAQPAIDSGGVQPTTDSAAGRTPDHSKAAPHTH